MSVKVKVLKREYFRSFGGPVVSMSESSALKFVKQGIVKIIDKDFISNPQVDIDGKVGSWVDPDIPKADKANLTEETKALFPDINKKDKQKEE